MNSDKFVYYDADFLAKFKKLAEVMEEKDKAVLHRYLIDNFSHIFKVFQYYAREDGNGGVKEFEEADAAMKRELMRPLSFRQYRMIQRSETWIAEEEDRFELSGRFGSREIGPDRFLHAVGIAVGIGKNKNFHKVSRIPVTRAGDPE